MIKYGTPIPIQISSESGQVPLFTKNPLIFYNFKFIFFNPQVNLTLYFYDKNGKLISETSYVNSIELSSKNSDFSMIEWTDTNNYLVSGWIQTIIPETQEEANLIQSEFNLNIVPIGQININSPLDSYGNVKVDLETSIPSGTNTIGNIGSINSPIPFRSSLNISTISNTLTTSNTAQALPSGTAYNFIIIYNKNSDTIYIGNSTTQNIPIGSNGSLALDLHQAPLNLSSIYWVSATAGDYIEVLYV